MPGRESSTAQASLEGFSISSSSAFVAISNPGLDVQTFNNDVHAHIVEIYTSLIRARFEELYNNLFRVFPSTAFEPGVEKVLRDFQDKLTIAKSTRAVQLPSCGMARVFLKACASSALSNKARLRGRVGTRARRVGGQADEQASWQAGAASGRAGEQESVQADGRSVGTGARAGGQGGGLADGWVQDGLAGRQMGSSPIHSRQTRSRRGRPLEQANTARTGPPQAGLVLVQLRSAHRPVHARLAKKGKGKEKAHSALLILSTTSSTSSSDAKPVVCDRVAAEDECALGRDPAQPVALVTLARPPEAKHAHALTPWHQHGLPSQGCRDERRVALH
ncbi:uncharacterized protein B0H18DRAFT_1122600 [Fomitopsis serialis]|uniref:uncharacterized protein n=1 Tax=Fomitopsis serialis TaxID=139415 RepID=UPI00200846FA|nr:uncharacterized protein B0H18DRAFT_1122600 [Neoantrodia serialis]KAH9919226.1 hypothetical protein B0H18DRAFT_1122600 [Neoantrodia serialis]